MVYDQFITKAAIVWLYVLYLFLPPCFLLCVNFVNDIIFRQEFIHTFSPISHNEYRFIEEYRNLYMKRIRAVAFGFCYPAGFVDTILKNLQWFDFGFILNIHTYTINIFRRNILYSHFYLHSKYLKVQIHFWYCFIYLCFPGVFLSRSSHFSVRIFFLSVVFQIVPKVVEFNFTALVYHNRS